MTEEQRDRELFHRTFFHLKASPETGKAVCEMMETRRRPKKFILRRALVAAAVLAAAAALSLGVNAATGGELFHRIKVEIFMQNGEKEEVYMVTEADGKLRMVSGGKKANGGDAGKSVIVYEDADGETTYFEWNPEEGSSKAP